MAQQIEVPGMGVVEFPDGMSDADIASAIQRSMNPATDQQKSMTTVPSRMARGAMDPVTGLAQMLYNAVPSEVQGLGTKVDQFLYNKTGGILGAQVPFNEKVAQDEQAYQSARQATGQTGFDAARLSGGLLSTIPAAMAMPGISGATMPARMLASGAIGGAFGATNPVTENQDQYWTEKAKQVGTGAAFGAVAAPVAEGIARVVKPVVDKSTKLLMDAGVTPTPGQIMGGFWKTAEDKARSIPILGDFITAGQKRSVSELNRAAYAKALEPIGVDASKLTVGHDGVQAVKNALGGAYDDVLSKLTFKADNQFAQELNKLYQMSGTFSKSYAKQFDKIVKEHVIGKMTPAGTMSGETLKQVESELSRLSSGNLSSQVFGERQLGDAIGSLQDSIRKVLERSNPQYAARLQDINKGYSFYAIIRKAASMRGAQDRHGVFTPAELASAVKAADKTVGKGATATGKARMQDLSTAGTDVIGMGYPDSGTAGRLLLGGGAIGSGMLNPAIPMSLAAGGLPYTPIGQRLMSGLLTKRPESAGILADAIRQSSPAIGAVSPLLLQ